MATTEGAIASRLDRPVDGSDHALGPDDAELSLVEYGSYACPHCRAANEEALPRAAVMTAPSCSFPRLGDRA